MALVTKGVCALIEVYDMPTAIAFYRDVLGFVVHQSNAPGDDCDWCWLKRGDDVELMLNTMYERDRRPAARDPEREAAHRDTCLYFGCPDVDAAYQHLSAKGIRVDPPKVAPYGMKQLYLKDPDGYGICFQWQA